MAEGKSTVFIGLQYGDEGKARVLDTRLSECDAVARFNGGPNAGHTLEVRERRIALHQVPSGIFYKDMILYIGSGCVLNPEKLLQEIDEIASLDISVKGRLFISGFTSLIQPHHILFDKKYGNEIGSTKNGIGPCYADRAIRAKGELLKNVRLGEYLANPEAGRRAVRENLREFAEQEGIVISIDDVVNRFHSAVLTARNYLSKDPLMLERLVSEGKNIFFEGAQSAVLDVVTGFVPYVTASRTIAGAAYTGGDLSNRYHDRTIGVAKAIMSRVGNGPFISEFGGVRSEKYCAEEDGQAHTREKEMALYDPNDLLSSKDQLKIGIAIRMLTNEYGATTKRPRRIGMLDLVMLRQNCMLNGVDELFFNKFDCLSLYAKTSLPGIPLVVGYRLDGKRIDYIPVSADEARRTLPVITHMPFIKENLSDIRSYARLPHSAKDLISRIEKEVGTRVAGIGVGPKREEFIRIP